MCVTPCRRGGSVYPEHKQRLAAGLVRRAMIRHCEMWLTEAACCPLHCNCVCLSVRAQSVHFFGVSKLFVGFTQRAHTYILFLHYADFYVSV